MTKYLADVDSDLWKAFKTVATMEGSKVKDAVVQALEEYIKARENTQIKIDFKVVSDTKRDLLTFVYEEELKQLIADAMNAQKREAPPKYVRELRERMLTIVKKHPTMQKTLADEVLQAFKALG